MKKILLVTAIFILTASPLMAGDILRVFKDSSIQADLEVKPDGPVFVSPISNYELDGVTKTEVEFGFSFGMPVIKINEWELRFQYAQVAKFEIYDKENSSPFRTTDYAPALFVRTPVFTNKQFDFGYRHQSNGEEEPMSRSWERIFLKGTIVNKWDNITIVSDFTGWYSFWEEHKDMTEYLGNGELNVTIRIPEFLFIKDLWAKGSRGERHYAVTISHPTLLLGHLYSIYQYRDGYGYDLFDYDKRVVSISYGIALYR